MISSYQKRGISTLRKMLRNTQKTLCSVTQIPRISTATDDGQELYDILSRIIS
jgi:hypothetical protein